MESTPVLKTARLLLTQLKLGDVPAIQQWPPHWEVVRYLDSRVPWPDPDDGALTYVRDIALASSPFRKIGSISLYDRSGNNRGFWLSPQWYGQGYIREAGIVINTYWFEVLQQSNASSERHPKPCFTKSLSPRVNAQSRHATWRFRFWANEEGNRGDFSEIMASHCNYINVCPPMIMATAFRAPIYK